MANAFHIVVCAGIVPDPLQTLEPTTTPNGPGIKNEMVLPAVLDPWAACALYEAAALAAKNPGSKLWLVSLGPKAKLQQVMMTVAQKVAFELVPVDGPIGGFPDAHATAAVLAETIAALPGLDRSEAAALRRMGIGVARRGRHAAARRRAARHHGPVSGRGPDRSARRRLLRSAGARGRRKAQVSVCAGAPAVLGWATGNLAEPRNNPQVGMANMRTIMPALQKAKTAALEANSSELRFSEPAQTAARDARREEHERRRRLRASWSSGWRRQLASTLLASF